MAIGLRLRRGCGIRFYFRFRGCRWLRPSLIESFTNIIFKFYFRSNKNYLGLLVIGNQTEMPFKSFGQILRNSMPIQSYTLPSLSLLQIYIMQGPKKDQPADTKPTNEDQPQPQPQSQPPKQTPTKQTRKYQLLLNPEYYFPTDMPKKLNESFYNIFSIIDSQDEDRLHFSVIFKQIYEKPDNLDVKLLGLERKVQRGVACFLGLAICDALGASTQFIPFVKERRDLIAHDFNDVVKQIRVRVLDTRSGKVGIWTDDCSMALCMADSLLLNNFTFDAKHMRYMFHMWLEHGLNNGGRRYSIGLGGNIAISMGQYTKHQQPYTQQGDKFNNGNGSLMRLAPVPLCFIDNEEKCMEFSEKSSRTTHNGDEAKECCRLLALILSRLVNRGEEEDWRGVVEKACKDFVGFKPMETVACLALSQEQSEELFQKQAETYKKKFLNFNKTPADRNWNWKSPNFTYSECRTKQQPGYIGSYCMDALSMALHTVWHSSSFQELALINANMGGDCDTVGAIAGQIGGAIYGIGAYMMHLYGQMEDVKTGRMEVFLKAYKLMTHRPI